MNLLSLVVFAEMVFDTLFIYFLWCLQLLADYIVRMERLGKRYQFTFGK